MQQQNFTPLYPPLQVRTGVLVVDGFGIVLRVQRGRLHVKMRIGRQRRSITLDRVGTGLERLVLIGKGGMVSLEALSWLRAIGAAFVQIGNGCEVLAHSVPFGYDGLPIRRAQAVAVTNGLDLDIARELIEAKLAQRRNLVRLGADLPEFDALRAALGSADSIDRIRVIEANSAGLYFGGWRNVQVRFRDPTRVPVRWLRADSRASLLTGAPRAATSPLNAMRDYLFACLESEARLALLAFGLESVIRRAACRPAQSGFACARCHGTRARRRRRVSPRSRGRSGLYCARFWRVTEWRLPDRSAINTRTRVNTSALAWAGATDRRAARTTIPQCSHGHKCEAPVAREIAAGGNASQGLAAATLRK